MMTSTPTLDQSLCFGRETVSATIPTGFSRRQRSRTRKWWLPGPRSYRRFLKERIDSQCLTTVEAGMRAPVKVSWCDPLRPQQHSHVESFCHELSLSKSNQLGDAEGGTALGLLRVMCAHRDDRLYWNEPDAQDGDPRSGTHPCSQACQGRNSQSPRSGSSDWSSLTYWSRRSSWCRGL